MLLSFKILLKNFKQLYEEDGYYHWLNPLEILDFAAKQVRLADTCQTKDSCEHFFIDEITVDSTSSSSPLALYYVIDVTESVSKADKESFKQLLMKELDSCKVNDDLKNNLKQDFSFAEFIFLSQILSLAKDSLEQDPVQITLALYRGKRTEGEADSPLITLKYGEGSIDGRVEGKDRDRVIFSFKLRRDPTSIYNFVQSYRTSQEDSSKYERFKHTTKNYDTDMSEFIKIPIDDKSQKIDKNTVITFIGDFEHDDTSTFLSVVESGMEKFKNEYLEGRNGKSKINRLNFCILSSVYNTPVVDKLRQIFSVSAYNVYYQELDLRETEYQDLLLASDVSRAFDNLVKTMSDSLTSAQKNQITPLRITQLKLIVDTLAKLMDTRLQSNLRAQVDTVMNRYIGSSMANLNTDTLKLIIAEIVDSTQVNNSNIYRLIINSLDTVVNSVSDTTSFYKLLDAQDLQAFAQGLSKKIKRNEKEQTRILKLSRFHKAIAKELPQMTKSVKQIQKNESIILYYPYQTLNSEISPQANFRFRFSEPSNLLDTLNLIFRFHPVYVSRLSTDMFFNIKRKQNTESLSIDQQTRVSSKDTFEIEFVPTTDKLPHNIKMDVWTDTGMVNTFTVQFKQRLPSTAAFLFLLLFVLVCVSASVMVGGIMIRFFVELTEVREKLKLEKTNLTDNPK